MKTNEDKLLEKFIDTILKGSLFESPSTDFTTKVMSQVLVIKKSEVYVYKPLISNSVFIFVLGLFIALSFYLKPQTDSWISSLCYSIFNNNHSISTLYGFSKTTIYSVVLATLILFLQISFLKKYFDKQFEK